MNSATYLPVEGVRWSSEIIVWVWPVEERTRAYDFPTTIIAIGLFGRFYDRVWVSGVDINQLYHVGPCVSDRQRYHFFR